MQKVSFEKEKSCRSLHCCKTLGKKCRQANRKKKPKHFEIITLILQSINVHTAKMTCKRWANDKMIY